MELSGWKRTVPYQNSRLKKRKREREKEMEIREDTKCRRKRNWLLQRRGTIDEERRGVSGACYTIIRTMNRRAMIAEERVDSRINTRPFSPSIDVAHRRRPKHATRSKSEFLPPIPSFRSFAIFVTKRFAILTGPLIIETVCDKLSRGEEEKEGSEAEEISSEVSIIVVMEPAGFRMYRTYRSFPPGRQWMSPYLNHCWVKRELLS